MSQPKANGEAKPIISNTNIAKTKHSLKNIAKMRALDQQNDGEYIQEVSSLHLQDPLSSDAQIQNDTSSCVHSPKDREDLSKTICLEVSQVEPKSLVYQNHNQQLYLPKLPKPPPRSVSCSCEADTTPISDGSSNLQNNYYKVWNPSAKLNNERQSTVKLEEIDIGKTADLHARVEVDMQQKHHIHKTNSLNQQSAIEAKNESGDFATSKDGTRMKPEIVVLLQHYRGLLHKADLLQQEDAALTKKKSSLPNLCSDASLNSEIVQPTATLADTNGNGVADSKNSSENELQMRGEQHIRNSNSTDLDKIYFNAAVIPNNAVSQDAISQDAASPDDHADATIPDLEGNLQKVELKLNKSLKTAEKIGKESAKKKTLDKDIQSYGNNRPDYENKESRSKRNSSGTHDFNKEGKLEINGLEEQRESTPFQKQGQEISTWGKSESQQVMSEHRQIQQEMEFISSSEELPHVSSPHQLAISQMEDIQNQMPQMHNVDPQGFFHQTRAQAQQRVADSDTPVPMWHGSQQQFLVQQEQLQQQQHQLQHRLHQLLQVQLLQERVLQAQQHALVNESPNLLSCSSSDTGADATASLIPSIQMQPTIQRLPNTGTIDRSANQTRPPQKVHQQPMPSQENNFGVHGEHIDNMPFLQHVPSGICALTEGECHPGIRIPQTSEEALLSLDNLHAAAFKPYSDHSIAPVAACPSLNPAVDGTAMSFPLNQNLIQLAFDQNLHPYEGIASLRQWISPGILSAPQPKTNNSCFELPIHFSSSGPCMPCRDVFCTNQVIGNSDIQECAGVAEYSNEEKNLHCEEPQIQSAAKKGSNKHGTGVDPCHLCAPQAENTLVASLLNVEQIQLLQQAKDIADSFSSESKITVRERFERVLKALWCASNAEFDNNVTPKSSQTSKYVGYATKNQSNFHLHENSTTSLSSGRGRRGQQRNDWDSAEAIYTKNRGDKLSNRNSSNTPVQTSNSTVQDSKKPPISQSKLRDGLNDEQKTLLLQALCASCSDVRKTMTASSCMYHLLECCSTFDETEEQSSASEVDIKSSLSLYSNDSNCTSFRINAKISSVNLSSHGVAEQEENRRQIQDKTNSSIKSDGQNSSEGKVSPRRTNEISKKNPQNESDESRGAKYTVDDVNNRSTVWLLNNLPRVCGVSIDRSKASLLAFFHFQMPEKKWRKGVFGSRLRRRCSRRFLFSTKTGLCISFWKAITWRRAHELERLVLSNGRQSGGCLGIGNNTGTESTSARTCSPGHPMLTNADYSCLPALTANVGPIKCVQAYSHLHPGIDSGECFIAKQLSGGSGGVCSFPSSTEDKTQTCLENASNAIQCQNKLYSAKQYAEEVRNTALNDYTISSKSDEGIQLQSCSSNIFFQSSQGALPCENQLIVGQDDKNTGRPQRTSRVIRQSNVLNCLTDNGCQIWRPWQPFVNQSAGSQEKHSTNARAENNPQTESIQDSLALKDNTATAKATRSSRWKPGMTADGASTRQQRARQNTEGQGSGNIRETTSCDALGEALNSSWLSRTNWDAQSPRSISAAVAQLPRFYGVCFDRQNSSFMAQLQHRGRRVCKHFKIKRYRGVREAFVAAVQCRQSMESELFASTTAASANGGTADSSGEVDSAAETWARIRNKVHLSHGRQRKALSSSQATSQFSIATGATSNPPLPQCGLQQNHSCPNKNESAMLSGEFGIQIGKPELPNHSGCLQTGGHVDHGDSPLVQPPDSGTLGLLFPNESTTADASSYNIQHGFDAVKMFPMIQQPDMHHDGSAIIQRHRHNMFLQDQLQQQMLHNQIQGLLDPTLQHSLQQQQYMLLHHLHLSGEMLGPGAVGQWISAQPQLPKSCFPDRETLGHPVGHSYSAPGPVVTTDIHTGHATQRMTHTTIDGALHARNAPFIGTAQVEKPMAATKRFSFPQYNSKQTNECASPTKRYRGAINIVNQSEEARIKRQCCNTLSNSGNTSRHVKPHDSSLSDAMCSAAGTSNSFSVCESQAPIQSQGNFISANSTSINGSIIGTSTSGLEKQQNSARNGSCINGASVDCISRKEGLSTMPGAVHTHLAESDHTDWDACRASGSTVMMHNDQSGVSNSHAVTYSAPSASRYRND